jgi:organic radical activating enzyme
MDGVGDIKPLDPAKFRDPEVTANGETRAHVALKSLETLWINTGTLCNLTCENCYIESSPRNDRLAYISFDEMRDYLDEIAALKLDTVEIAFTGGEPFMNPEIDRMLEEVLSRGYRALVLTNAMRPMRRHDAVLKKLRFRFDSRLVLRVSVDHYTQDLHEKERGPDSWQPMLDGLKFLSDEKFTTHVAGRMMWDEDEASMRAGFGKLFAEQGIQIDANDPVALTLFPEMDMRQDVPEITDKCWSILGVDPNDIMCATSRMVVKRKGADRPAVIACTLLPYDDEFELGATLSNATGDVALNHPHCAKFCVLGGGACSRE